MDETTIIAKRIAHEFKDGDVVNLGIGIPTASVNFIPEGVNVYLHSENGMIGVGPTPPKGQEDKDIVNAGGGFLSAIPVTSYMDSASSFAIVRGGHLDMTVLGALQVDEEGSIANWIIPGKMVPGMGGAMDLLTGAKKIVAAMKHTDKEGKSKILKKCTLPLTAYKKLSLIVTDLAVIEVTPEGLVLREIHESTTVDEVVKCTEAKLILPSKIIHFS